MPRTPPAAWRVVFAGTPEFAVPTLDALVAHGVTPVAVYTQPDRPAGRGRKITPSPVKRRATDHGIAVFQPESLKDESALRRLAALKPDLIVVVAYGQLLGQRALATPKHGCVNVHASLLPRWRGAAPIQRALLAGDSETGVSIMRMEVTLDTGPVLLTKRTSIKDTDTGGTLHDRLAALGAEAMVEAYEAMTSGTAVAVTQSDVGATYARKIVRDDARLDWTHSAVMLWRQVRAFDPWPVAHTVLAGETVRIWRARPRAARSDAEPGTVIETNAGGFEVATGEGVLHVDEVQVAGRNRVAAAEFARGLDLTGKRFG